MEIKGVIKAINPEIQVSPTFKKKEVVVQTLEQYPQSILIEFHQDKCDLLKLYMEGQQVKIGINLRGREWTSPQGEVKYFNTIVGWNIFKDEPNSVAPQPPAPASAVDQYMQNNQPQAEEESDDLPF